MARWTKKYMTADYERLYNHASLLDDYLYDTQSGRKPDATEKHTNKFNSVRVQLWRAKSATGGYVVVMETLPNIWYLDDAIRIFSERHDEYSLALRICLERLTVIRNRAQQQETVAVQQ